MEFKLWPLDIGGRVGVCDFWGMGNSLPWGYFVGNWAEKEGEIILHINRVFALNWVEKK